MVSVHSGQEAVIPTATGPLTVAQILNAAADAVEPDGAWTQHVLCRSPNGQSSVSGLLADATCFCAEGAIAKASEGRPATLERQAFDALRRVIPTDFIHEWNDRPDRTQAEVVAALRAAAVKADTNSLPVSPSGYGGEDGVNQNNEPKGPDQ